MSHIKLKVCGLMSPDEARLAIKYGADYAGLNFVPVSPRCISIEIAREILKVLISSNIKAVGVFQNQPREELQLHLDALLLDYLQLHGEESAEYASSLNKPIIKAVSTADMINNFPADYFLLDRPQQGQGDLVDLIVAQQVIEANPDKIFLAGGLEPANLAAILSKVRPFAVDIANGVRTDNQLDEIKLASVAATIRTFNQS